MTGGQRTKHRVLLIGSGGGFIRLAIALKRMGNEIVVLSDSEEKEQYAELKVELTSSGIRQHFSDEINGSGIISVIRGTEEIKRIIKKEGDFDVIQSSGLKQTAKVFFAMKRLNKRPETIATIVYFPRSKIGKIVASVSYNLFYDKCIALSNLSMRMMIECGINPKKICVIPLLAPDLEWFDKAADAKTYLEDYNLQDLTKPVIFYAARHVRLKGFPYYLMAASKVLKKFDATFVVGGSGPLTSSIENFARKLGIYRHVIFAGWIYPHHMPYILRKTADICVSTSLKETLAVYVLECMAAGRPVVASSVGVVPDAVINGVNGYIVPPYDYEETAQRLVDLLGDPEKARRIGLAGRKTIEDKFNMKKSVLKLSEFYEEFMRN